MGVFFERQAPSPQGQAAVAAAIEQALRVEPATVSHPVDEARRRAAEATADASAEPQSFQTGRFLIALALVAVLVVLGIWSDAQGYQDSSKQVFGLAATAFGVIVGLLGGEKGTATN
jgi:hypothetical protein